MTLLDQGDSTIELNPNDYSPFQFKETVLTPLASEINEGFVAGQFDEYRKKGTTKVFLNLNGINQVTILFAHSYGQNWAEWLRNAVNELRDFNESV